MQFLKLFGYVRSFKMLIQFNKDSQMPLPVVDKTPSKPAIKTTLAIAAGKGGVGKSTVAVNLALALHSKGMKVGVMDTDIYGPSVRKMMPEKSQPSQHADRFLPADSYGIKVMSMAFFRGEGQPAAIRAPIANSIINQFIHQVDWGELDFLLIDFPPGTGDIQMTLAQQARIQGAILVTTPQEVALLDVRKAAALFIQVGVPLLGVVENMSFYQPSPEAEPVYLFGKDGGARLAAEAHIPLLGQIPVDPQISFRADRGFSLFADEGAGPNPAAKAFLDIADSILKELPLLSQRTSRRRMADLQQIDAHRFTIKWDDGAVHSYRLSDVQKACPCAACAESPSSVDPYVCATKVTGVGQYALRFEFTSGCVHGIYAYDQLYQLGRKS